MAFQIDTNPYAQLKTFEDYNKAQQLFEQQKRAAQIDAATKQNVLATQVLSGATDQSTYDAAKQQLSSIGVDTSQYSPDFATGVQQAQQARLAQSPLGSLLNAGLKSQSNQIALGVATGQIPVGADSPLGALGIPGLTVVPAVKPAVVQPASTDNLPHKAAKFTPLLVGPTIPEPAVAPVANPVNAMLTDMNGGNPVSPLQFQPPAQNPGETLAAYNQRAQRAFDEFKLANTGAIKQAETQGAETGKNLATRAEGALGTKAILHTYNKLGSEAAGVPGGFIENAYASLTNAANAPSQGAINKGAYEADLNNLYLGTIRSMKGTGRIMQAELQKIAEAAPKPTDSTEVKIAKTNAHLDYYNTTMKDNGFNPSNGQPISQDNPAVDVPPVPMPGKSGVANLPTIASPQDPAFQQLPSGAHFIGPDGKEKVKH